MKATIGIYAYIEGMNHTPGGVESQSSLFVRYLKEKGYRVIVHCLLNKYGGFSVGDNGILFGIDEINEHTNFTEYKPAPGPGLDGLIERNIKFSKDNKEDVIIAFGTRDGFVFDIAGSCAKTLGIPYIPIIYFSEEERRVRAQFGNFTRSIPNYAAEKEKFDLYNDGISVIRKTLEEASRVIVPTHYIRAQIGMMSRWEDTFKIRVAYHGVDPSVFNKRISKRSNNIIQISRLNIPYAIQKNFLWFVEAIKKMKETNFKGDPWTFKIIGPGNGVEFLNECIKKFDIDNLTLSGYISQDMLAQELADAKVLFAPSMMEAGTTVLVEAALAGTLPVALNYAGSGEILENLGCQELGILPVNKHFDSDNIVSTVVPDHEHFVEIMERINTDDQWVEKLRTIAYEKAMERYTINTTGEQMIEVMKEVL